jgi:hypothetical protein
MDTKTPPISNEKIKNKLREYLGDDRWGNIMGLIKNKKVTDLNGEIENGNNLFHLACIKGKTKIIHEMIKLKNNNEIKLNTNLLNDDGLDGIYLYYKYGGSDLQFLDAHDVCNIDSSSRVLAFYMMDRIDMLEKLMNKMFKKGCIDNTELPDDVNIYNELIVRYIDYSKLKDNDSIHIGKRYLDIVKKLYEELKTSELVFVAIKLNAIPVIRMLINFDFDFMIYSDDYMTPLSCAILYGRLEIVLTILHYTGLKHDNYSVYKMIHASKKRFNNRPIFIAMNTKQYLFIDLMIQYMGPYIRETDRSLNAFLFSDELSEGHSTYLHRLLSTDDIENVPPNIMCFFLKYTDLNQENYYGITCAHLISMKDIWKRYDKELEGREMDLLKLDNVGNNCYSYIKSEDKSAFLEFTKTIKIPINIKNSNQIEKTFTPNQIKKMIDINYRSTDQSTDPLSDDSLHMSKPIAIESEEHPEQRIGSRNFGLFPSTLIHYMLYLYYIEKKFKTLYVPTMIYSESEKTTFEFFFNLTAYDVSPEYYTCNTQVRNLSDTFYSYLPHLICWIDEDQYFIHPKLVSILKAHDMSVSMNDQRYVMLKITIIVSMGHLHANVLIYDRKKKEGWRFEPYGISDMDRRTMMDAKLCEILEEIYGKIKYYDPDSYLKGLNFQLVDGEDYIQSHNWGDPDGYCLAWSMWFLDVVLSNPERDIDDIMKNFFSRHSIGTIISDENMSDGVIRSDNYYLDFIRRYAHKLDDEKNKILLFLGVKKYNMYNIVLDDSIIDKIKQLFVMKID